MIDTLLAAKSQASASPVLGSLGLRENAYGLVTLHRPSNVDESGARQEVLAALDEVSRRIPLVFPVHPRTRARLVDAKVALDPSRWTLTDPLGYLDFLRLMSSARVVLTDSGGVQEETTVLGVPCVTLRNNTERPVTISEGTNRLGGTSREGILAAFGEATRPYAPRPAPRFWDGRAADRIASVLEGVLAE